MTNESSIIPPDKMPDAPEHFDMIPDDEAKLPTPPIALKAKPVDLHEPDLVGKSADLPTVSDLPVDWVIVILAAIAWELELETTLPLMWEKVRGEKSERVLVRSLDPMFVPPRGSTASPNLAHAMAPAAAEEFIKWVGAQTFIRKSRNQYVECVPYSTVLRIDGADREVRVVVPSTNKIRVLARLNLPVDFPMGVIDEDIGRRARAAMSDPTGMLTPIELDGRS